MSDALSLQTSSIKAPKDGILLIPPQCDNQKHPAHNTRQLQALL